MQVIFGLIASGIDKYLLMMMVPGLSAFLPDAPTIQTDSAANKEATLYNGLVAS